MTFEEKINEEIINTKNNWNNRIKGAFKLTELDIRQIFAMTHEVNLQRDKTGRPIPGSGRLITNEEKKQVFDYILAKDYPVTRNVYNLVLNAYLNEEIELSNVHKPKL